MARKGEEDAINLRERLHTQCYMLSNLHNPTKVEKLKAAHSVITEERRSLEKYSKSVYMDMLLDAVATLLSAYPKGGIVAVGMRGLTQDKISVIASMEQPPPPNMQPLKSSSKPVTLTGSFNLRKYNMIAPCGPIEKFARNFFENVQKFHKIPKDDLNSRRAGQRHIIGQVLKHAHQKIHHRYSTRCQTWINTIITQWNGRMDMEIVKEQFEIADKLGVNSDLYISINIQSNRDDQITAQIQQFMKQRYNKVIIMAPKITPENFNEHHLYYVDFLHRLQTFFGNSDEKGFKKSLESTRGLDECITIFDTLQYLVYSSKNFRKYFIILCSILRATRRQEIGEKGTTDDADEEIDEDFTDDEMSGSMISFSETDTISVTKNVAFQNIWCLAEHVVVCRVLTQSRGFKHLIENRTLDFSMLRYNECKLLVNSYNEQANFPKGNFLNLKIAVENMLDDETMKWTDFKESMKQEEVNRLKFLYDGRSSLEYHFTIHAEVIVMLYLNNLGESQKSVAHDYIGISKGPCLICDLLLKLLASQAKAKPKFKSSTATKQSWTPFRARKGHGHIYPVWVPVPYLERVGHDLCDAVHTIAKKVVIDMAKDHKLSRSPDSGELEFNELSRTASGEVRMGEYRDWKSQ